MQLKLSKMCVILLCLLQVVYACIFGSKNLSHVNCSPDWATGPLTSSPPDFLCNIQWRVTQFVKCICSWQIFLRVMVMVFPDWHWWLKTVQDLSPKDGSLWSLIQMHRSISTVNTMEATLEPNLSTGDKTWL